MVIPHGLYDKKNSILVDEDLFVTRYTEQESTRIQTKLKKNLFVFVTKGKKKVEGSEVTTILSKGEFGFFRKNNYIMNQILSKDEYESLLIFLSDEYLYEMVTACSFIPELDLKVTNRTFTKGINGSYVNSEVSLIIQMLNDTSIKKDEIIHLKVRELMLFLLQGQASREIKEMMYSCHEWEDDLIYYMEENFDKNQDLYELASGLNMSTSTFKRKFMIHFNETPGKWISKKRLEKAALLLRTTDFLVTDICFLCGYDSVSAFYTQFKRHYGISPGQFTKL